MDEVPRRMAEHNYRAAKKAFQELRFVSALSAAEECLEHLERARSAPDFDPRGMQEELRSMSKEIEAERSSLQRGRVSRRLSENPEVLAVQLQLVHAASRRSSSGETASPRESFALSTSSSRLSDEDSLLYAARLHSQNWTIQTVQAALPLREAHDDPFRTVRLRAPAASSRTAPSRRSVRDCVCRGRPSQGA